MLHQIAVFIVVIVFPRLLNARGVAAVPILRPPQAALPSKLIPPAEDKTEEVEGEAAAYVIFGQLHFEYVGVTEPGRETD